MRFHDQSALYRPNDGLCIIPLEYLDAYVCEMGHRMDSAFIFATHDGES